MNTMIANFLFAYQEVISWILEEEGVAYFCFMLIWSLLQNIEKPFFQKRCSNL